MRASLHDADAALIGRSCLPSMLLSLLLVAASCGGDGVAASDPGSQADASILDAASVPDGGPEPNADAGPSGMAVNSVATSDGYTQVRQGQGASSDETPVELVIAGAGLDAVTDVSVGELAASIREAGATEVRVTLEVPHAVPPGPRDVVVSAGASSVSLAAAIEVTPFVVAPSAPAGGHGTFQSPLRLCDDTVERSRAGDTIFLLEGTHACPSGVDLEGGGQIIRGTGTATTLIGGTAPPGIPVDFGGFRMHAGPISSPPTSFTDLAIDAAASPDGTSVQVLESGHVVLERAVVLNGRIQLGCPGCTPSATVRESHLARAPIDATGETMIEVSDSILVFGRGAIRTRGGRLVVRGSTFQWCLTGVALGEPVGPDEQPVTAEIRDTVFMEDQTGVTLDAGSLAITDTFIGSPDDSVLPTDRAIYITGGDLAATGLTMSGLQRSGIEALVSADRVATARVTLADTVIEGGQYGIDLEGSSEGGGLFMSSSVLRGQTVAAVKLGFARASGHDLRGGNQLSVAKGGVALDDARVDPLVGTIEAAGIALNGHSYAGRVEGPTERLPDYRILDRGAIQF